MTNRKKIFNIVFVGTVVLPINSFVNFQIHSATKFNVAFFLTDNLGCNKYQSLATFFFFVEFCKPVQVKINFIYAKLNSIRSRTKHLI